MILQSLSAFLTGLVTDQHLLLPANLSLPFPTIWRELIQQQEPDASLEWKVRGRGETLLRSWNGRSQLAGRKIAAVHSDVALHHENGEVLKQVSNRSLVRTIPGCFQNWTTWDLWQTDLVLKPSLFWNDLQNPSHLNFPVRFCTPLHLRDNSVLTSQEVLIFQKYFYFSVSRSIFPCSLFVLL